MIRKSDVRAIRRQIETFEKRVESKGAGRFECWADDMQTLGWARVLCDMALLENSTPTPEGQIPDEEEAMNLQDHPPAPPGQEPRTFTVYVCPECGKHGFKFGTEHSIPLVCDDGDGTGEHHGFPPERVEVTELSALTAAQERIEELNALVYSGTCTCDITQDSEHQTGPAFGAPPPKGPDCRPETWKERAERNYLAATERRKEGQARIATLEADLVKAEKRAAFNTGLANTSLAAAQEQRATLEAHLERVRSLLDDILSFRLTGGDRKIDPASEMAYWARRLSRIFDKASQARAILEGSNE